LRNRTCSLRSGYQRSIRRPWIAAIQPAILCKADSASPAAKSADDAVRPKLKPLLGF
jgi:hypothetical protein